MGGLVTVVVACLWSVSADAVRTEFPTRRLPLLLAAGPGGLPFHADEAPALGAANGLQEGPGTRVFEPPQSTASVRSLPSRETPTPSALSIDTSDSRLLPSRRKRHRDMLVPDQDRNDRNGRYGNVNGLPPVGWEQDPNLFSKKAEMTLCRSLDESNVHTAVFDGLNDDIATVISRLVKCMVPTMKVIDFAANKKMSNVGWESVFEPLTSPEVRLQELRLGNCDLDDLRADAIGEKLSQFGPTVKKVDMSGNYLLSPTGWTIVLTPLARYGSTLEDICFSGNDLEDVRGRAIAEQLMHMGPTVKALHYSGNKRLSSFGWTALLRPITGAGSRFEDVRFGECDLDDDKAKAIFMQFINMGPTIRKLDFEGNKALTARGWMVLLNPLSNYYAYRYLEEVNFGYCDLDDIQSLTIGRLLNQTHPRVKVLNFANSTELTAAAWERLLSPLTALVSGLVHVGFGQCHLNEATAETIGRMLSSAMPTVRLLEFENNAELTDDGWTALLDPLGGSGFGIEEVNFGGCSLSDESAKVIGEQLNIMDTSVKKLNFANNAKLTADGWIALLKPMTRFGGGLEEMDFRDCKLDDDRAQVIGEQLGNLVSSLRRVSFRGNDDLSPAAWTALLLPLTMYGSSLEEIDFSGCNLDAQRAQAIGKKLMKLSPSVKVLSFKGMNMLTAIGWDALLQPLTWEDPRHQAAQPMNNVPRLRLK